MGESRTFSEQLRKAIEDCGASRYALARQLGISESALSRFMSGKHGLSLANLDRLADVLGLEITVSVQKVRRSAPRGRQKKEKRMVAKKLTPSNWQEIADHIAYDEGENHWESRRGVGLLKDVDRIYIYDNHPYANIPGLRDRETAMFRDRLTERGIRELAYAIYPKSGAEKGYTYAMIIDAGEDHLDWVRDTWREILTWSNSRFEQINAK